MNHTTYSQAGVDIDRANALVDDIKTIAARTHRRGVINGIGGFGALFELSLGDYPEPVLVSGTDGVGTKLKLAMSMNQHDTIGIDLVAMCVNDIITLGADPLFFLDYYASGKLSLEQARDVIKGIGQGCEQAGCALIGGETAEMPGMYQGEDYDLAGFVVGAVDKSAIIDGSNVKIGDQLIALASSGPHSNGYSLIRYILDNHNIKLDMPFGESTLGETLLKPTRIYAKSIHALTRGTKVHALAHITGGGIIENLPRVLPANTAAHINLASIPVPEIFNWLQAQGNIEQSEMLRTFNMGVGMIACVAKECVEDALGILKATHEKAWVLGSIRASHDEQPCVVIN